MFFYAIQGHHILISGIFTTFDLVPLSKMTIELGGVGSFAVLVSKVTAMALKLSAPIMVAILFMNVAIAVVGRAVPQINILITSLPVNALSGFFIMFFALPLMIWKMTDLVNLTADELFKFIKTF
jgi:flagellar biosynthetic protein FliR